MDLTPKVRELFTNLRSRPGMYLGNDGLLSELKLWMDGMNAIRFFHSECEVQLLPEGFQEFVAMRYLGRTQTPLCWSSLILQHEPDERAAFRIFWELLDAYLLCLGYEPIPVQEVQGSLAHADGISPVYYAGLSAIADSYIRTFNAAPWHDHWNRKEAVSRLRDMYHTPGFFGLAIWKDGVPFGALLGRCEHYFDGMYYQIVEFWIEPSAQKQGYGGQLLRETEQILAARGIRKLYLITMHGEATEGFYRHYGFTTDAGLCVMDKYV